MRKYLLVVFLLVGLTGCISGSSGNNTGKAKKQVGSTDKYKIWRLIDSTAVTNRPDVQNLPRKYQALTLDIKRAKARLKALEPTGKVPDQLRYEKTNSDHVRLQLPWNNGEFYTFVVKKSNVFSPELAKKFPNIRSYSGEKEEDSRTHLRLDVNPAGLYAMITAPSQTLFIRPLNDESKIYLCYDKNDVDRNNKKFYEPPVKTQANE